MEKKKTIKNIFKINFLVYILGIASILIGAFKDYIILNTIIIIHELGHFLVAIILGVETDKIYIYPLGGISKYNMYLNDSSLKELLILIFGPFFQNMAYLLLIVLLPNSKEIILTYHLSILIFNLLPIYPLDGGRILNIILNKIFPYKKSFKLVIKISYVVTVIIFIIQSRITIYIIIMSLYLLVIIHKEENKMDFIYNKFLLERIIHKFKFKSIKYINNKDNFYKDKYHYIKDRDILYREEDYLKKYFYKKNVDEST